MLKLPAVYLIIKNFQKAVYLPELVIHGLYDLAIFGKDAHIDKWWDI